jgi:hypothetical protein
MVENIFNPEGVEPIDATLSGLIHSDSVAQGSSFLATLG